LFYFLGCSSHWYCCSRWCCHIVGVTTCIDVVLLACSCSFSDCFTNVFHCIVLMFSLHVIVVFRALMELFFSSCCVALFALVIGMSFFSSYCVVHFMLLHCYFFSHCCIFFSFSHSLNHVALLTLSRNSFCVTSHYCIVLLALLSLVFLHCHSFYTSVVDPFIAP